MSLTAQPRIIQPIEPVADSAGCRVLHLRLNNVGKIASAECPGMADEAAKRLVEAGATWRDEKFRLQRMADVCRELNLPPFALLQTPGSRKKNQFEVPLPLAVPFEPIELNETQPALAGIIETLVLNDEGSADAVVRRSPWYTRSFVRLGALSIIMFNVTIQSVVQTITQTAMHGFRFWFIAMIWGIFAITVGGCAYWLWRTSAQWFLIPGGVVIRRTFWKKFGVKLERYAPADTLLMIVQDNFGWYASLIRKNRPAHRKHFTRMEATALLAAWQSPILAKRVNEMSDLVS